jgi:23S rRNA maturation mini-RNase III
MFNATELLKQWNEKSGQQKKQIIHFSENSNTKRIHRNLDFGNYQNGIP